MRRYLGYLATILIFTALFSGLTFIDAAGYATKSARLRAQRRIEWTTGRSRPEVLSVTIKMAMAGFGVSVAGCMYLEWRHRTDGCNTHVSR